LAATVVLVSAAEAFDAGIADLRRAAEPGGVFSYTFVKAVATAHADEAGAAP
jgi:hypothetical protein